MRSSKRPSVFIDHPPAKQHKCSACGVFGTINANVPPFPLHTPCRSSPTDPTTRTMLPFWFPCSFCPKSCPGTIQCWLGKGSICCFWPWDNRSLQKSWRDYRTDGGYFGQKRHSNRRCKFCPLTDPKSKHAFDLLNQQDLRDQVGSYRAIEL